MNVRDVRQVLRGALPALCVVAVAGVLHRRAAVDAWADDRGLAAEPSWLQMAAPFWHSAVHDSISVANGLVRLIDPLTGASTAGDTRALAALIAALSAGALFVLLRRAQVPLVVATLLCGVTIGSVLPVAATASVSHALQMLLGTALILTWSVPASATSVRAILMTAMTAVGAATHASFLAFAAGVWIAGWLLISKGARRRVAAVGGVALALGLVTSSWLLAQNAASTSDPSIVSPGTSDIATGLLTGRFAEGLQPSRTVDWLTALGAATPAPMILSLPLAVLAFARRETRAVAIACVIATALLLAFVWRTWLPDPGVAGAPARLTVTVLIGLGLSWVAAQAGKGATTLAFLASALIGLRGFAEPIPWTVPVQMAQMQSFVEAAPAALDSARWSGDRLAVSRALLGAHPALAAARISVGADALATVPGDQPVVTIGTIDRRSLSGGVWYVPFDVSYPSADRFLASQPERLWMSVAVRGQAADGFCSDLLTRLSSDAQALTVANPTVLVRVGSREPRASLGASERLDVEYGRVLAGAPEPVPARVAIEATPTARILINRHVAARTDQGMAIATFDPWTADVEQWVVGPCDRPVHPAIRDRRLAAAYAVALEEQARLPRIPAVLAEPLHVQFDVSDWFGAGWHGAEGGGESVFRWTSAVEAHVSVPVARPQPLRIRMQAALATAAGTPNGLGVSWNGTTVHPVGPWADEGDWLIPASLVHRGMNVFTIRVAQLVSPAASGGSSDTRPLGAAVRRLSFEPLRASERISKE